jgi:hypothetical protein
MPRSLPTRPNLPPQQSSEHQVEIGGKFRLACTCGSRMGTQHQLTAPGERGKPPSHQFPEPSLYPVADHRRANRTADYKAYLWLGVVLYLANRKEQVPGHGGAARPATRAHRLLELLRASHPRLLRQHDPSSKRRLD